MSQTKAQLLNPLDGNLNVTGIVTAGSFSGDGSGLTGVASTDNIITSTPAQFLNNVSITGITTIGSSNGIGTVTIGVGTEALYVDGNARVIGILTVGRSSITLDGDNNTVNVGAGVTLDGTTGEIKASSLNIGGQSVSSLGVGIGTTGGIVGYGATLINLYGPGVSTAYYDSNVGIATIYFEGGGGGGGATNGYVAGLTAFLNS